MSARSPSRNVECSEFLSGSEVTERARMRVIDAAARFKSPDVSTLSVTMGGDRLISHKADIHPAHREEFAKWLVRLARRIGAAD